MAHPAVRPAAAVVAKPTLNPSSTPSLLRLLEQQPRHYAVIEIKQRPYLVTRNDMVICERMSDVRIGDVLQFSRVREVGSQDFVVRGAPLVRPDWVRVTATVVEHPRSKAIVVRKFKKRKNYHRHFVHRQTHTVLRIADVQVTPQ